MSRTELLTQPKLTKCNYNIIADSTNYLHIAGQPPNNAADYVNATMMAVSMIFIQLNIVASFVNCMVLTYTNN